jgi:hypothetical protein
MVHHIAALCQASVTVAELAATWAARRDDATGGRLAADALQIATAAHWLQNDLAAALEGGVSV